ncbi:hypothetical protein F4777DRAFT_601119 [Nemania sp. FL0916]|nr:hypothetical protein F4777DRAFT_601119 [Nemania sp. FL0916]
MPNKSGEIMANLRSKTQKPLASELVALDDRELDRYLEDHLRTIEVEDPENLPESFIQRLRDRARPSSERAQSHPIDLYEVNARLLALPSDYAHRDRIHDQVDDKHTDHDCTAEDERRRQISSTPGETPRITQPPTPDDVVRKDEYDKLVNDGGRPVYPLPLFDQVAANPRQYLDILAPWQCETFDFGDHIYADVFKYQLDSWRGFRRFQLCNRIPGPPDYLERSHVYRHFFHYFRRKYPDYREAARNLLAQYDFTRPFQFHDDATRQDKLTTWTEYLVFMCATHHAHARWAERSKPKYDEAWKRLVDHNVLRPHETEEYIVDGFTAAAARQIELDEAQMELDLAEQALISVQNASSNVCRSGHNMNAAKYRLDAAKESLAIIEHRNECILHFFAEQQQHYLEGSDYQEWKRRKELHRLRFRWVLDQLPIVEVENNAAGSQDKPHLVRGTKRGFPGENSDIENHRAKRRRSNPSAADDLKNKVELDVQPKESGCFPDNNPNNTPSPSHPRSSERVLRSRIHNSDSATGKIIESQILNDLRHRSNTSPVAKYQRDVAPKAIRSAKGRHQRQKSQQRQGQLATAPAPPRRSARIKARQGNESEGLTTSAPLRRSARIRARQARAKLKSS